MCILVETVHLWMLITMQFRKIWSHHQTSSRDAQVLYLRPRWLHRRQKLVKLWEAEIRISLKGTSIMWPSLIKRQKRERVCMLLDPSSKVTTTASPSQVHYTTRLNTTKRRPMSHVRWMSYRSTVSRLPSFRGSAAPNPSSVSQQALMYRKLTIWAIKSMKRHITT